MVFISDVFPPVIFDTSSFVYPLYPHWLFLIQSSYLLNYINLLIFYVFQVKVLSQLTMLAYQDFHQFENTFAKF